MSDDQLMMNRVHYLDCIEFLKKLPDNSVDSCVTDPPYGLEFMGKDWDKIGLSESDLKRAKRGYGYGVPHGPGTGRGTNPTEHAPAFDFSKKTQLVMQQWHYEWAVEVFRVLKHGAHLLAFGGTRTYHRLACAIEDAGFEIRDQIHWLYGSGFPKGQNISKAIDKKFEKEIIMVGTTSPKANKERKGISPFDKNVVDGSFSNPEQIGLIFEPTTDEAKQWQGWNTQLKPAHEPIVFARKPISEKSIVDNVLIHGTGAINIDACRVAVSPDVDDMDRTVVRKTRESPTWEEGSGFKNEANPRTGVLPTGRYPANLILSHHPDCKSSRMARP